MEKGLQASSENTGRKAWYAGPAQALADELRTDLNSGLPVDDAARRRAQEGPNELPEAEPPSLLKLFLSQFTSLIVWVLIGAAIVSGLLEDWIDTAAILAIVFFNGVLGFVQEFRAERSLAALRKMSVSMARVIRDGALQSIPARELVRGDLVALEAGDRIPADARLIYTTNFQAQEASLTGESTPVQKQAEWFEEAEVPLADQRNMVFMGTVAVSGKAHGLVVATGVGTELGRIAALIQKAAEAERAETPLQRRLEQFGSTLLWLALGVVTIVFMLGFLRGEPLVEMFLISVSLAVAAVPEGLPAVVTVTLAVGVMRMAKRHALIRKLPAVETLGSATVICTDKTGTLTKNEMTVTKLVVGSETFEVTGEGYEPVGEIKEHSSEARVLNTQSSDRSGHPSPSTQQSALPPGLRDLLTAAVLCNSATLQQEKGIWRIIGDPTEGALLVAAAKVGLTKAELEGQAPREREIPFDAERKMMTIVRRTEQGCKVYSKGAPDVLLKRCATHMTPEGRIEVLDAEHRRQINDANASLAQQALRVLGVAYRPLGRQVHADEEVECDLIFLGLLAMKDPLRSEATEAVRLCRQAGIRTAMITGDHKETAVAIARELGLQRNDDMALSGAELDGLTDEQLMQQVERVTVYARVSAEHKLRVVQAWKRNGAIVAMTGDGVNDAPAIKASDIGVAMGLAGTDVTKEASDMVVTDDNFASIAAAVEEGRGIFDNIRKTVHFLLSCNMSEVLVMLFATLFGLPLPLLPIHILWMNLVTDGFPALALAVDPKAPDLMQQPPRQTEARLLDGGRLWAIAGEGLLLAGIALSAFSLSLFIWQQPIDQARTVTFTVMVAAQLVHAFNCRSDRWSLFKVGVTSNRALIWAVLVSLALQVGILTIPILEPIFKVAPLPIEDWALMVVIGLLPLAVVEGVKWVRR
ncbi:Calcium-transporting ATPase [Candidatus Nitrospira nitrosa]|uniref:Calcium-transporting ATPase n=1 Tax=Candidatus Nitrospira nitrosa TaxID=1742972 RepID=A0A0S4L7A1_9BACT|nr:cation-translocating P-type ATPase [Candidatus Nitrospira nitrosa]CUS32654.1 Calcium-transporting ATPase [Candidatus Nitrospira nitrosa]